MKNKKHPLSKVNFVIGAFLTVFASYIAFFSVLSSAFLVSVWQTIKQIEKEQLGLLTNEELYDLALPIWEGSFNFALYTLFILFALLILQSIIKKRFPIQQATRLNIENHCEVKESKET